MNHYERLKVNPDAPIEVIRAAYRALAAKHHPDRHTQPGSSHGDMVALNAAYEVLADPAARAAYDAELADAEPAASTFADTGPASRFQNLWRSTMGFGNGDTRPPGQPAAPELDESRVDVHWQPPLPMASANPWLSKKRLVPLAGLAGVAALVVVVLWARATMQQMEAEQTLSQHYGGKLPVGGTAGTATGITTGTTGTPGMPNAGPMGMASPGGRPAHSSAATMSDEELLAEPTLPGQAAATPRSNHVLDGTPLTLRQDKALLDPLATLPKAAAHP